MRFLFRAIDQLGEGRETRTHTQVVHRPMNLFFRVIYQPDQRGWRGEAGGGDDLDV